MKGKKHQWKCFLVLLLAIALIGSSVDYTMLSAFAQEEDRGGSQEETAEERTRTEKTSFLSGVPLEQDEADSEGTDGEESDKVNPEEPGEEKPVEGTLEEPGEEGPVGENPEQGSDESEAGELESTEVVLVPEVDMPGNDELFEGYLAQLFYGDSGISLYGNVGGDRLPEGNARNIYNTLKNKIKAVANGTETSTAFSLGDISFVGATTPEAAKSELGTIMGDVLSYLLMDCPYDLYWFNKTSGGGIRYAYSMSSSKPGTLLDVTVTFAVANEYQGGSAEVVDSSKVAIAKAAAAKAQTIVEKHAGKSDYEKLMGYKEDICNLVSYNQTAADNSATPYGNPWQLVWVFDEDTTTNVVCEGYSKAFQYLCDLSGFKGCYTVTGTMRGGTGAGPHMWNIVTLNGGNYLVDVTNCDEGTIGYPDKLFLVGGSGSVSAGYTCSGVTYSYDDNQKGLFGEGILTLSAEDYVEKGALTITAPTGIEVTFGDAVSDGAFEGKGGFATDADGNSVDGTFKWDKSVSSFGAAGLNTCKAIFVPTSSDYRETSTQVTVKVNPKPITVAAKEQTKKYGDSDPELTYEAEVVDGYPLSGKLVREAGEDVKTGGYKISQGTVTEAANPNYKITFRESTLTIEPADCTEKVEIQQNILVGVGEFRQPSYTGVKNEVVTGTTTYTYNQNDYTYETLVSELAKLKKDEKGKITYVFKPDSSNYNSATGTITFEVKDILFQAGDAPATDSNAVTLKSGPAYGDTWSDIVTINNLTAVAGIYVDSDQSHFSLNMAGSDMPNAGTQSFEVLYNGTIGGKTYKDEVVCQGKVTVNRRILTVAAGSYKVSKVYDKTTAAGTASGELALSNILTKDKDAIAVTAVPGAYTNPNVAGQKTVKVSLTLSGAASSNYSLSNTTLDVPGEITPMPIVPTLEPLGSYDYTGSAITPALTVKNGEEELAASDYEAVWSNNVNAGTAKVEIKPAANGNYTWTAAVSETFVINKVAYTGEKARSVSVRFGGELNLDLAPVLPAGYQLGEIKVADEEKIFESGPVMTAATLSGRLVYDKANVGKTATITIPVTNATNFLDYDYIVTVAVADKMEQTGFGFGSAVLNKTYGDGDFSVSVVNAAQGSKVTFTSSNPEVAQIDEAGNVRILRAGTAVLQAQASETDEYFGASSNCILNVVPKALTWNIDDLSARDKEGAISSNKATLYGELKVSGILEADAADAVFSCPASMLTGTYAAVNAGIQNVTLAWADPEHPAVLQGSKAGNYKLPETLPGFTGRINAVRNDLPTPAESTAGVQYSLSMEMGISQVPQAFLGLDNLNTPAKIEVQMQLNIQSQPGNIPSDAIAVYDVVLMVNVNGTGWAQASKDNFPASGLTVTLPYPEGTGQDKNDFVVCHLFTEDMNGHRAGDTEYPAVEKTAEGIRFKVYGLSPISVGWTDIVKTDDTQNPGSGSSGGSQNQAAASSVNSPKTSDNNHVEWYLLSMVVSGSILGGMFIWNKKRKKG